MNLRFRSEVDAWLIVSVGIGVAVPAIIGGQPTAGGPVLIIRHRGPFRFQMPLSRLRELRGSHEAMSAPALSLDRIEIPIDKGLWLLASPSDRLGFIWAIQDRVPWVKIHAI